MRNLDGGERVTPVLPTSFELYYKGIVGSEDRTVGTSNSRDRNAGISETRFLLTVLGLANWEMGLG